MNPHKFDSLCAIPSCFKDHEVCMHREGVNSDEFCGKPRVDIIHTETKPCPGCERLYGHLTDCPVEAMHACLDRLIETHGWNDVMLNAGESWEFMGKTPAELRRIVIEHNQKQPAPTLSPRHCLLPNCKNAIKGVQSQWLFARSAGAIGRKRRRMVWDAVRKCPNGRVGIVSSGATVRAVYCIEDAPADHQ